MRRSLALAVASAIILASCQTITITGGEVGSGIVRSEAREIGLVTEVHATASIVTHVTIGSPASLRVTADDNLLDNVITRVVGSQLDLAIEGGVRTTNPITVTLVVPSLDTATADASARIELAGLDGGSLRLRAESSGVVEVSGQVTDLDVRGSSSGRLDLSDLDATSAIVRLESSAQAWVRAADRIAGDVSSSAVLTVVGDPAAVDVTTSSSGRVERD